MDAKRPFCRKCLMDDLPETDYLRYLKEYIADYPRKKRVPDDEYRRRLGICLECDHLSNGTCELCGCYVELRALKKGQFCPDSGDRWKPSEQQTSSGSFERR